MAARQGDRMEPLPLAADAGQDLRAFLLHGLEPPWTEPQQLQDRRCNLRRFHAIARMAGTDRAGGIHDERNITIGRVIATVLCDLRAGRVDGADL